VDELAYRISAHESELVQLVTEKDPTLLKSATEFQDREFLMHGLQVLAPRSDGVLIEFLCIRLWDYKTYPKTTQHYIAFVMGFRVIGGVCMIDLGEAEFINPVIGKFRREMEYEGRVRNMEAEDTINDETEDKDNDAAGIQLYNVLIAPIEKKLVLPEDGKDASSTSSDKNGSKQASMIHFFIAPDAQLCHLPFELLAVALPAQ